MGPIKNMNVTPFPMRHGMETVSPSTKAIVLHPLAITTTILLHNIIQ